MDRKGVLGDVGIHILDFATFAAGMAATEVSCLLQTFDKAPGGRIGDYVLDANDSATMQVRLANGALGTVGATRFATGHLNDLRLRLYGLTGGIEVSFRKPGQPPPRLPWPEHPYRHLGRGRLPPRPHGLPALHRRDPRRRCR